MNLKGQNFTEINPDDFPNSVNYKIGIVVSEWNIDITSKAVKGGIIEVNVILKFVLQVQLCT